MTNGGKSWILEFIFHIFGQLYLFNPRKSVFQEYAKLGLIISPAPLLFCKYFTQTQQPRKLSTEKVKSEATIEEESSETTSSTLTKSKSKHRKKKSKKKSRKNSCYYCENVSNFRCIILVQQIKQPIPKLRILNFRNFLNQSHCFWRKKYKK